MTHKHSDFDSIEGGTRGTLYDIPSNEPAKVMLVTRYITTDMKEHKTAEDATIHLTAIEVSSAVTSTYGADFSKNVYEVTKFILGSGFRIVLK